MAKSKALVNAERRLKDYIKKGYDISALPTKEDLAKWTDEELKQFRINKKEKELINPETDEYVEKTKGKPPRESSMMAENLKKQINKFQGIDTIIADTRNEINQAYIERLHGKNWLLDVSRENKNALLVVIDRMTATLEGETALAYSLKKNEIMLSDLISGAIFGSNQESMEANFNSLLDIILAEPLTMDEAIMLEGYNEMNEDFFDETSDI